MADGKAKAPSLRDQKRQLKLQRKQDKLARKRVRKEEKTARKLARRDQRQTVAYRSLIDRAEAVQVLEDLLAGVKSGQVAIEHDGDQLQVAPAHVVDLSVRTRQTHKAESLTIRVRWPRTAAPDESESLKVTSG